MPYLKGKNRITESSDKTVLLILSISMLIGFIIYQQQLFDLTGRMIASCLIAIYGILGLLHKRINFPFVTLTGKAGFIASAICTLVGITTLAIEVLWI